MLNGLCQSGASKPQHFHIRGHPIPPFPNLAPSPDTFPARSGVNTCPTTAPQSLVAQGTCWVVLGKAVPHLPWGGAGGPQGEASLQGPARHGGRQNVPSRWTGVFRAPGDPAHHRSAAGRGGQGWACPQNRHFLPASLPTSISLSWDLGVLTPAQPLRCREPGRRGGLWAGSQGRWGGPLFSQKEEGRPASGEPSLHPHPLCGQKLHPVTWPPGHRPSVGGGDGPQGALPFGGGDICPLCFRASPEGSQGQGPLCPLCQAPCSQGEGPGSPTSPEAPSWPFALWLAPKALPSPGAGSSEDPHRGPKPTLPLPGLQERPSGITLGAGREGWAAICGLSTPTGEAMQRAMQTHVDEPPSQSPPLQVTGLLPAVAGGGQEVGVPAADSLPPTGPVGGRVTVAFRGFNCGRKTRKRQRGE